MTPTPVRIVTAAALFDGHDAAITVIRRVLQARGAEVIHLGHDRSVDEVVAAVIEEDAHGVGVSSYQGGHLEYFGYLVDRLAEAGSDARVFGGGGGVIVADEVEALASKGVRIYSPADGQRLGLVGMADEVIASCRDVQDGRAALERSSGRFRLPRVISLLAEGASADQFDLPADRPPVLGITGTGGSGKSSLTDELLLRFRRHAPGVRIAVLAIDPTARRGGALLGDRIRMNALDARRDARPPSDGLGHQQSDGPEHQQSDAVVGGDRRPDGVFFRSLATRGAPGGMPVGLDDMIRACGASGYDVVVVETPGMGQGDAAIADHANTVLYVMTPEYGASTQLEKIAALEVADLVAINKSDRRGAEDARRDVARQLIRNRGAFGESWRDQPVIGTIASRVNDDGVDELYRRLVPLLGANGVRLDDPPVATRHRESAPIVPRGRERYLAEVADAVRTYHAHTAELVGAARRHDQVEAVASLLDDPTPLDHLRTPMPPDIAALLADWRARAGRAEPGGDRFGHAGSVRSGGTELSRDPAEGAGTMPSHVSSAVGAHHGAAHSYPGHDGVVGRGSSAGQDGDAADETFETLSGLRLSKVAAPASDLEIGELVRYLRAENRPGSFPFTAGVFPHRRSGERPTRMFAGEGDPARTNRRFHLLAAGQPSTRLSTAFDSVTLYGRDPSRRPDVYGKVGTSGVSIATLDDMRELFAGFDLGDPSTSVSMTINGPAPTILAMFFNAAIDAAGDPEVVRRVRGTVQADILKEDQGQNTCLFSIDFSLRAMADVQEWFIEHGVERFYSVSISGYHIAEAGANPITQLALTLANGLTYVEAYLARGMAIDDFAPNLSFFFSNGMDAEYSVIGRVARRIWAVALRDRYGGGERAQKLKYHIQTSGRSLHAAEMEFNDIRTTLQALCAFYDSANSLHTNAYDEAVTTPSAASVRRALAIQLIVDTEWGLAAVDNPLQGSYLISQLTDLVEEAVLAEFDRLADRGGVLGAMETGYQRGLIQDESMLYESRKHDGTLPIVGVNTFLDPDAVASAPAVLARGTTEEKESQLARLADFHARHAAEAPAALARLKEIALAGGNVFDELMRTVRVASLGQITDAFFDVGGRYRRTM